MGQEKLNGYVNEVDKEESTSGKNELMEKVEVKDTPFTAIRMDDKWFLTMGKYRLTEPRESLDAVMKDAEDASWWRILQVINIMIQENEKKPIK